MKKTFREILEVVGHRVREFTMVYKTISVLTTALFIICFAFPGTALGGNYTAVMRGAEGADWEGVGLCSCPCSKCEDAVEMTHLGTVSDIARDVVIQPDGKTVVVGSRAASPEESDWGDYVVARYNRDLTLDPDFGTKGVVVTRPTYLNDEATTVSVDGPEGSILVGGFPDVYRYLTNGQLDNSFGRGGVLQSSLTLGGAHDSLLIYGGKILEAGSLLMTKPLDPSMTRVQFAVAQFNGNGGANLSFGSGGIAQSWIDDISSRAEVLGLQSDGKIIAAGKISDNDAYGHFAVVRFNSDGSLDTSFGPERNGKVLSPENLMTGVYALAVTAENKILLGGFVLSGETRTTRGDKDFVLYRYLSDGNIDTTFGQGGSGMSVVRLSGTDETITSMKIRQDGKIVATGPSNVFKIARFNPDGSLDSTFGKDASGVRTISFGEGCNLERGINSVSYALDIQRDGGMIVVGYACTPGKGLDFAIARVCDTKPVQNTPRSAPADH